MSYSYYRPKVEVKAVRWFGSEQHISWLFMIPYGDGSQTQDNPDKVSYEIGKLNQLILHYPDGKIAEAWPEQDYIVLGVTGHIFVVNALEFEDKYEFLR